MKEFEGRVGVVTGAGRGIGLAMARTMARHGMRVVLSDLEPAQPERAANALRGEGSEVVGMVCDVSDPTQVEELATRTVERFGRVDLLCNNAGVVAGGRTWDISLDDWRRVLSVNLWGAIHGVRSFIPLLMAQPGGGHVVNVASLAAVNPWPAIAPYNVSKQGLLALSETLLGDLRAVGSSVGVTVVMPGRVATGIGLPSGEPVPDYHLDTEPGMLSAESVADQIMEAVERDQLYLFTHPDRMEQIEARFDAILRGGREG
jgi:NAD(P)-dependent dehydrogenase (short-subunit alcohol dehydrogenase family)